jgi:hypothetical protein
MARLCLPALLLLASLLPAARTQSLDTVYWTPIVGQPQVDTSQALSIVNGTDCTVFQPSSAPGAVKSMVYQASA